MEVALTVGSEQFLKAISVQVSLTASTMMVNARNANKTINFSRISVGMFQKAA